MTEINKITSLIEKGKNIQAKFERDSKKINYVYRWNNELYSLNDNLLSNKKTVECKVFIFITSVYDYKNKNHIISTLYEKKDFSSPKLNNYFEKINRLVDKTADISKLNEKTSVEPDEYKFLKLQSGASISEKNAAEESLCHYVIGSLNLKGFVLLNKIDPSSKKSVGNNVYFLVYN